MTMKFSSFLPPMMIPPLWAAIAFTVYSTIYTLNKPGGWYWPLIHEMMSFAISIVPLYALNILVYVPVAWLLSCLVPPIIGGIIYMLCLPPAAAFIAYEWKLLGSKPTIWHASIIFGAFLPALVMAISTWLAMLEMHRVEREQLLKNKSQ